MTQPRTEAGRDLLTKVNELADSADVWVDDDGSPYMDVIRAAILAIEKEAPALAHDRPSGSGLREALERELYTVARTTDIATILAAFDRAALSGSKPSASADAEG